MYYVPDGTERCGFYECSDCGNRFLDIRIAPSIVCPYCAREGMIWCKKWRQTVKLPFINAIVPIYMAKDDRKRTN